jgi:anti-anti-sigma regulatory factor
MISAVPRSNKFMLRITENSKKGKTIRLRLDGTLTAASYSELETLCSQYQGSDGKIILLDMAGVVFMNDEVAKKLIELRSDRLTIINCSPFIEALFETVAR